MLVSIYAHIHTRARARINLPPSFIKDLSQPKVIYDKPRQHIKEQRHYFANKGPSSQGYGFSHSHVWM